MSVQVALAPAEQIGAGGGKMLGIRTKFRRHPLAVNQSQLELFHVEDERVGEYHGARPPIPRASAHHQPCLALHTETRLSAPTLSLRRCAGGSKRSFGDQSTS